MGLYTGTEALEDLRLRKHDRAVDWGFEKINEILTEDLNLWSRVLAEYMGFIATPVTEQGRIWGVEYSIPWQRTNETTRGRSGGDGTSNEVMFPIYKFAPRVLGWTEDFLKMASAAEVAELYAAANIGYKELMLSEIKKALFRSANFDDVDPIKNTTLHVKRLLNADSDPIPSYGGVSFDGSTHTHYLARVSTLANSDVNGVINTVREHGGKNVKLFVNQADLSALANISGTNFVALTSGVVIPGSTSTTTLQKADPNRDDNDCMVGYWNIDGLAYEVWVKPEQMMPRYYMLAASTLPTNDRPLAFRQFPQADMQGVRMSAPSVDGYVFTNRRMESWFGFGGNGRSMAAVLYINGTSWADAV